MITIFTFIFIAFLGAAFGSFLNVVILRVYNHEKGIITGRSKCPHCKHELKFLDLFPIFSYVFLLGRCRYCKKRIGLSYLLMELFTGAIWVFTIVPYYIAIEQKMWIPLLYLFVLVNSLILISVYDWRYLEIPNKFSFPLIFLLIMSLFLPFTPTPQDGLLAAAILFLFFYAQILLPYFIYAFRKHKYSILKDVLILPFWFIMQIFSPHKWFENESIEEDETPDDLLEWVGFGDLRIAFVMGLVLGVKYSFFALFISYFFGAIIGVLFFRKDKEKGFNHMPFAPFLAIGTFVMLVSGNLVLALYHNYTDILSSFF